MCHQLRDPGPLGVNGESAPQHVTQDPELEQESTLGANHVLDLHQTLEIVSVSISKISRSPEKMFLRVTYL